LTGPLEPTQPKEINPIFLGKLNVGEIKYALWSPSVFSKYPSAVQASQVQELLPGVPLQVVQPFE